MKAGVYCLIFYTTAITAACGVFMIFLAFNDAKATMWVGVMGAVIAVLSVIIMMIATNKWIPAPRGEEEE